MTTGKGIAIFGIAIAGALLLVYDAPAGYLPLIASVYAVFMEK